MITIIIPITAGVQRRLSANGCSLAWHDNKPLCIPSDAAVQAVLDGWTVADARAEVVAMIDARARALRDGVVAGISSAEMASWALKREQSLAYDGTDESAPMLALEASSRGVPTSAVVDRVLAKAAALSQLEAHIAGAAGKHGDAVKALATHAEVVAYDCSGGWPL
ncbi:MAG: hypothetical protein AW12_00800 [Candidatus Accumulibacter sp. BA-94]|nr:MAG: hypothetical protein AW12_00800 [Candidatus Accumulibacter sp. BA-94]